MQFESWQVKQELFLLEPEWPVENCQNVPVTPSQQQRGGRRGKAWLQPPERDTSSLLHLETASGALCPHTGCSERLAGLPPGTGQDRKCSPRPRPTHVTEPQERDPLASLPPKV